MSHMSERDRLIERSMAHGLLNMAHTLRRYEPEWRMVLLAMARAHYRKALGLAC